MSNIQAAIGCAQMQRIEELIERKREILYVYKKQLANIPGITLNPEPPRTVNGAWMPTVVFAQGSGVEREKLHGVFKAANIDARVFFWPLSSLPMFKSQPNNTIARETAERGINLPSYHDLKESDQIRVASCVIEASRVH